MPVTRRQSTCMDVQIQQLVQMMQQIKEEMTNKLKPNKKIANED